jgi:hypothetical protein
MAPFDDHGLEGVPPLLVVIENHDFMLACTHDFYFFDRINRIFWIFFSSNLEP